MPSDIIVPEYTHFVGPSPGAEIILKAGTVLDCSFEVKERTPCDPLYRLISVEENDDGTVAMILESVEAEDA